MEILFEDSEKEPWIGIDFIYPLGLSLMVLIYLSSSFSHILIIRYVWKLPHKRIIDLILLFDQVIQFILENMICISIILSLILDMPLSNFSDFACTIFSHFIALLLWQKIFASFLAAVLRFLYIKKPSLFLEIGRTQAILMAFITEMSIFMLCLGRTQLIQVTIGAKMKDAFCQGISYEFFEVVNHQNNGKLKF